MGMGNIRLILWKFPAVLSTLRGLTSLYSFSEFALENRSLLTLSLMAYKFLTGLNSPASPSVITSGKGLQLRNSKMLGDTGSSFWQKVISCVLQELLGKTIFPPSHIIEPEDNEFWNQKSHSTATGQSLALAGFNYRRPKRAETWFLRRYPNCRICLAGQMPGHPFSQDWGVAFHIPCALVRAALAPVPANKRMSSPSHSCRAGKQFSESVFLATNLRSYSLISLINSNNNSIINKCLIFVPISQLFPNLGGKQWIVNAWSNTAILLSLFYVWKHWVLERVSNLQSHQNLKYKANLAVKAGDLSLKLWSLHFFRCAYVHVIPLH